ncbi:MAG: helix-turn-helix transcriptional regulator [Clostridia bacterium]|nr:helix-turn-helix transcriptional regulator [Clostridia bacterium]
MGSICKFLPMKEYRDSIQPVYFVYEAEFHKLKQPFIYAIYYLFLITKGSGVLHLLDHDYPLEIGTLFAIVPGYSFTIDGSEDLAYMYISFIGDGAAELLAQTSLNPQHPTESQFDHLIPFWRNAVQRIKPDNANLITEGVLLYTLSYLTDTKKESADENSKHLVFDNILKYIEHHCTERDISLKKIAGIYAYSEKYLSHLFKQNMNLNFSEYLNKQRVSRATQCIGASMTNITEIATSCGYSDPLYFSKVFKKHMGVSPKVYIKTHTSNGSSDDKETDEV